MIDQYMSEDGFRYVPYHYVTLSSILALSPIYVDLEFDQEDVPYVDNVRDTIPSYLRPNIQNIDHESNVSESSIRNWSKLMRHGRINKNVGNLALTLLSSKIFKVW